MTPQPLIAAEAAHAAAPPSRDASSGAGALPAPTDATHEEARRATVHALGGAFEYSSSRHALEELSSVANRLAASRAQQPALKASRMAKGRFMARSPETASKGSPAAYLSDYMATDAAWDSPEAFQEALRRDVDQRIATVHLRPPPAVPEQPAGEPVQPAAVGAKQGAAPPLASKLPPRRLWREQPHMAERWWAACDSRLTSYNASSAGYASSEPSSNAVDVSAEPSASALPKAPRRAGISRAGRYAVRRRQVMRQAGIVDPLLNSTTRDSSDSGSDAAATSGSTSGSESGSGSPSQSDATSSFVAGRISLDQASGGGSEFRIPAVGGMADRVGVKGRMGVNPASVQALQLRLAALQR
ncbi:hypothetical protein WJX72_012390 [[Myrmecia] bisecta]|uniref:Uncharacterized protein n=1 Tax=[Myrmecia] bisecta TaxID=41462 RepID=A0AAW1QT66_9CHLO